MQRKYDRNAVLRREDTPGAVVEVDAHDARDRAEGITVGSVDVVATHPLATVVDQVRALLRIVAYTNVPQVSHELRVALLTEPLTLLLGTEATLQLRQLDDIDRLPSTVLLGGEFVIGIVDRPVARDVGREVDRATAE